MSDQIKIDGFDLHECLGIGGMATVWKARQQSLDRMVAIKVLSPGGAERPEDVVRFHDESRTAAKLKHPGIVQVYDAGWSDGGFYFVMEFVNGYTVGDWVRRKQVLPEADMLLVAECVADALDYGWSQYGVIHCDIKPDNVMVDADGTVKLTDLGLSRTISAITHEEDSDEVLGTPAYISPEQAMGASDMDCRADIYSLGAMLYHLGTGALMFAGHDESKVMELQVTSTVDDPSDLAPQLSGPMCDLIEKMLAKDRTLRHRDWQEVLEDIQRVKKGLPLAGKPLPPGVSSVKRSRNRPRPGTTRRRAAAHGLIKRTARGMGRVTPLLTVLLVLALVVVLIRNCQIPGSSGPSLTAPAAAKHSPEEARAERLLAGANAWRTSHVQAYAEAIQRYQAVIDAAPETAAARQAGETVERLKAARRQHAEAVMTDLAKQADAWVLENRFADAAQLYELYSGPMAQETQSRRKECAEVLRGRGDAYAQALRTASDDAAMAERRERAEARQRAAAERAKLLDDVVADLLAEGAVQGQRRMETAIMVSPNLLRDAEIVSARLLLDDARKCEASVLASFRPQVGKEITVRLQQGTVEGRVLSVDDQSVSFERKISELATAPLSFGLDDLALRERLARMGNDTSNGALLLKGLLAAQSQAHDHARRYFEQVPPCLGERLAKACTPPSTP